METDRHGAKLDFENLRKSEDYRAFLKTYLTEKDFSLSDFARAAGFGRGFPGDVISGKRRLTAKSFFAFEKALKLPANGKRFFRLLVAREEGDIGPDLSREKVDRELQQLRSKSWSSARRTIDAGAAPLISEIFRDPRAIVVYAAAGAPESGASENEIIERSRLSSILVSRTLDRLKGAGLVLEQEGRFFPRELHTFFKAESANDLVASTFLGACKSATERISPTTLQSSDEFFFSSVFCVDEKKMPLLKVALREKVLEFIDESAEGDGNRVVRFLAAMHL